MSKIHIPVLLRQALQPLQGQLPCCCTCCWLPMLAAYAVADVPAEGYG
jgi:hypothetical protein